MGLWKGRIWAGWAVPLGWMSEVEGGFAEVGWVAVSYWTGYLRWVDWKKTD